MFRRWDLVETLYKSDDFISISAARQIGDDLLTICLEREFDDTSDFLSTGVISQENLFTRFSSNERARKSIVPYYTDTVRCVDVTNDETALPDIVKSAPVIEESL